MMVTPLTELEYLAGVALFGLFKLVLGVGVVALACWGFFSFAVTDLGWGLVPIVAVLLLVGWVISLLVVGLVLRYGPGADILAWGLLFVVLPLSGVFYPTEALPGPMQPLARVLPTTHAFAAARALVDGRSVPWNEVALAGVGTLVAALVALAFVLQMLRVFRRRGYVTRFS